MKSIEEKKGKWKKLFGHGLTSLDIELKIIHYVKINIAKFHCSIYLKKREKDAIIVKTYQFITQTNERQI